jgi:diguanylate cyclase (GGDEF)-like protein
MAERMKEKVLVFYADLDDMKQINDTLGHQEGDDALVEAAVVLKETFRKSDVIGRMGGDEFAVLATGAADERGDVLANRLRNALEARGRLKPGKYTLSLSIGVAQSDPENPSSLDELMAQADRSMYERKRAKQR